MLGAYFYRVVTANHVSQLKGSLQIKKKLMIKFETRYY